MLVVELNRVLLAGLSIGAGLGRVVLFYELVALLLLPILLSMSPSRPAAARSDGTRSPRRMLRQSDPPSLPSQPEKGSQLQATGKMVKVGDKRALLATRANFGGQEHNISHQGQEYSGTVSSTRRAKVRGQEHLIAELKTQQGRKFLADLGLASDIASKVSEGAKLKVTGVPVELKDRRVLVARAIEKDGQRTVVRQGLPKADSSR